MPDWKKVATAAILADGQIDENEIAILRKELKEADGKIGDEGVQYLVELRTTAQKKLKATAIFANRLNRDGKIILRP